MSTAERNQSASGRDRLVVVSGPSGVGKSTIDREAVRRSGAEFSVSATTRPPRPDEVDGREYRFVDRETFEQMIRRGELLEWADVFGEYYGTPAEPVRRAMDEGRTILLEIDVQGGLQVHEKMPEATFVLIVPPDEEALEMRLRRRGTEDEPQFQRRLGKAKQELEVARKSGAYQHIVVNDDLERAIREVVDIIESVSQQGEATP
jgi:guanylate kinase